MKRRILSAIAAVFTAITLTACGTVTDKAYTYDGISGTYSGDWKNGQPEGTGTFSCVDGTTTAIINGDWKNGQPEGQITFKMTDDDGSSYYYRGAFSMGNPEGSGYMEMKMDGSSMIYEGGFTNGNMNGSGHFESVSDGTTIIYDGDFANNLRSGNGNISIKNSAGTFVYEGTFLNDSMLNGSYVAYNSNGNVAETGTYENGQAVSAGDKLAEGAIHAADDYLGANGLLDAIWDLIE